MNNKMYAGFWIRLAAYTIDIFLIGLVYVVPSFLTLLLENPDLASNIVVFLYFITTFILPIFYFGMMPLSKYQGTFGKYFVGLKIVDANGNKISAGKSWLRLLGTLLSSILYIGYIMIAFTEGKRGLHDLIANTYVVKAKANQEEATNSQSAI